MTATLKRAGAKPRGKSTGLPARGPIELPEGTRERIRAKAQELWEARGRRNGNALQDWLDAEDIVMEEIHEARE